MTIAETENLTELTTSQILIRAIEVLNAMGWAQGAYIDGQGRYCALAAIHEAAPDQPSAHWASQAVRNVLYSANTPTHVPGIRPHVPFWNDDYNTTYEEVIQVFTLAAKNAQAKEEGAHAHI